MINKKLSNLKMMGFAKFKKKDSASTDDVILAALKWQEGFLAQIDGISFATMLMNTRGEFADVIFAKDEATFSKMLESFSVNSLSKSFLELLDIESTKHFQVAVLKDGFIVPEEFGCLEFGTFSLNNKKIETSVVSKIGEEIYSSYLSNLDDNLGHLIGKVSEDTYAEVSFGTTLGHTKRICDGYLNNTKCMELVSLMEPGSIDLDFWVPVA